MSAIEHSTPAQLLTYSQAMRRLRMHYDTDGRIGGWQAYLDGCPSCFGACFLASTPNACTIVMARNLMMRCRLSFVPGEGYPLRFVLEE